MQNNDHVIQVVGEWIDKAENDLKNAVHTLKLGEDCPTDTACFHAQQCVEKYLKAILVYYQMDFPKTHDVGELLAMIPENVRPQLTIEEQIRLTSYATTTRYPGDYEPISLEETKQAIEIARQMRKTLRSHLPEIKR